MKAVKVIAVLSMFLASMDVHAQGALFSGGEGKFETAFVCREVEYIVDVANSLQGRVMEVETLFERLAANREASIPGQCAFHQSTVSLTMQAKVGEIAFVNRYGEILLLSIIAVNYTGRQRTYYLITSLPYTPDPEESNGKMI